jgi:hypothetical protein
MLADVWMASSDPNAITAAAEWFDARLARDPLSLGESRESSVHRVASHERLGIEFEVIVDDHRVIVQGVFAVK